MRIRFLLFAIISTAIAFGYMPTTALAEGPSDPALEAAQPAESPTATTTAQFEHSPVVPQAPGAADSKVTVPTVGPGPGDPKPGDEGLPKGTTPPKPGIPKPEFELCLEETAAQCEDNEDDSQHFGVVVELPCDITDTCDPTTPTEGEGESEGQGEGEGEDGENTTPTTTNPVPEVPTTGVSSPTTAAQTAPGSESTEATNIDTPRLGTPNFTG